MEYNLHSEYPVILRKVEVGVQGTWYQNNMKPVEQLHDELRKLGKDAEVNQLRAVLRDARGVEYRNWDDLTVVQRTELYRRTLKIIHDGRLCNPYHVVKIEGCAYFNPLVSHHWGVEGEVAIEFEVEHDPDFDVARYQIILDGPLIKGLRRFNQELKWDEIDEINIPYGTSIQSEIVWLNDVKSTALS